MKTLIGAIALALAIPAAAQTAPAANDPHAGHKMDHRDHQAMGHGAAAAKHDCKDCCEKMKQQDGKMECMDKKGGAGDAVPAEQHDGHGD